MNERNSLILFWMTYLRFLLFPLAILFLLIVGLKNLLYKSKIIKSTKFDIPIICVGNLSVGGTGKTPHTEYLIRLLSPNIKLATLSRGYGRKTSEFVLASEQESLNATHIGDEPMQYFLKYKNIEVGVDKKRVMGVLNLLDRNEELEAVILDDAFQHRAINAGLTIVLIDSGKPFWTDYILPIGSLRELKSALKRADMVVFTKCDPSFDKESAKKNVLDTNGELDVFFTRVNYGHIYQAQSLETFSGDENTKVLAVSGIAHPEGMHNYLREQFNQVETLVFSDHHNYSKKDLQKITDKIDTFVGDNGIIVTTEKDYARMQHMPSVSDLPIHCLPIEIEFLDRKEDFDKIVNLYVRENKADRKPLEEHH